MKDLSISGKFLPVLFCFVLTVLYFSASSVSAQDGSVPKWLFQSPTLQGAVRKTAGKGNSREAAVNDAAVKIMQSYQLIPEEESLIHTLVKYGHRVDPGEMLAPVAVRSSGFRVVDTYEMAGGETYVWCEYKKKDAQHMLDSLFQVACDSSILYLTQARVANRNGDFFQAVRNYTDGLKLVIPVGYRKITIPALMEEISLLLCTEYIALYDSLTLETLTDKFPMEQGRAIPYDFRFKVTKGGRKCQGVPLKIMITTTGQITQDNATDKDGILKCHVQKAPDTDNARINAILSFDSFLAMTPEQIHPLLENKFKMLSQQRVYLDLYPFDKTPVFLLDMNPGDSAVVAEMLTDVITESNYKITTDTLSSDLVLSLDLEDSVSDPIPHKGEDFQLVNYLVNISYAVYDRRTGNLISEMRRNDNKFLLKSKDKEKLRCRAVELLTRKYSSDIKTMLQLLKFDKAKYVYEEATRYYEGEE